MILYENWKNENLAGRMMKIIQTAKYVYYDSI